MHQLWIRSVQWFQLYAPLPVGSDERKVTCDHSFSLPTLAFVAVLVSVILSASRLTTDTSMERWL